MSAILAVQEAAEAPETCRRPAAGLHSAAGASCRSRGLRLNFTSVLWRAQADHAVLARAEFRTGSMTERKAQHGSHSMLLSL